MNIEKFIMGLLGILVIIMVLILVTFTVIDLFLGNPRTEIHEVKCYDRWDSEIKGMSCEKRVVCSDYGLLLYKCKEQSDDKD